MEVRHLFFLCISCTSSSFRLAKIKLRRFLHLTHIFCNPIFLLLSLSLSPTGNSSQLCTDAAAGQRGTGRMQVLCL
jgi:hypothetical protein